jgi:hexulose-6-phosphate isomerase
MGAQPATNSGRILTACKWGMIQGPTSVLGRFKLCKEVGFDGMELVNPLNAPVAEVLAASRETGMPVHGLVNIKGNRQVRISSPDAATRERGRALLKQSLENCHAYGGDTVLVVPGRVGEPNTTHDDVWQRSAEQIGRVLPLASKLGVRILIENVWNGFCPKPELMRDYIDQFNSPWVGSYFDIGNAAKFAPSDEWIRTLGPRIVKLDLKDWSQDKGLCDVGTGSMSWSAVCDALAEIRFTGWATAEVKPGGRDRLAKIVRQMKQVLNIQS